MTAISSGFRPHGTRVHRHAARSPWRDTGIGLAVALIVAALIVLGTHGRSWIQMDDPWPSVDTEQLEAPIAPAPRPGLFPRGMPSDYTTF